MTPCSNMCTLLKLWDVISPANSSPQRLSWSWTLIPFPSKYRRPVLSRSDTFHWPSGTSFRDVLHSTKQVPRNDQHIRKSQGKTVTSLVTTSSTTDICVVCKTEKHPLYVCAKFKSLSHEEKTSILRSNGIWMNCLGGGHFKQQYKSSHKCKICQRQHHTLLHIEAQISHSPRTNVQPGTQTPTSVWSNAALKLQSNTLPMMCRVLITANDGSSAEARALLDNASSASFISERLVQSLSLVPVSRSQSQGFVDYPTKLRFSPS